MNAGRQTVIYALLCFFFPFTLFALTRSSSLMFDDAAEFALVVRLGSIAHPPGTPAYIFFGMLWDRLCSFFIQDTVSVLTMFSSFSVATGSLLFYLSVKAILRKSFPSFSEARIQFASAATALLFATGATTWAWANTVEVYAFQVLAMSLTLFGLVKFHCNRSKGPILLASFGYALGLANHHVEALFFAPWIPLFFMDDLFVARQGDKKGVYRTQRPFFTEYGSVFKMPAFRAMVGMTVLFAGAFYLWMYWRAQTEYPFMFGQPKTLDLLWYHIKGGSYAKNLEATTETIRAARIKYFLNLTFFQYVVFLPVLLLGLYELMKKKLFRLLSFVVLFYALMFVYQLNNNQWSNTDAYMLIPFLILTIPAAYASAIWFDRFRLKVVLPVLLCVNVVYNFPLHDRSKYNVSESLLHLLDESAPKNSVILISDWSLVIQYYYARIAEGFRPDLVVLNYDVKFTHYRILPTLYPEFYRSIKREYDSFIAILGRAHPEQVTGTGCDLSSISLFNSFKELVNKVETVARQEHRALLTDPRAHFFYSQQKIYAGNHYVAGCFLSSVPTADNDAFLAMREQWLDSPLLLRDPTALDKLVDFQAMLDNHFAYFTHAHDSARLEMVNAAKEKLMRLQSKMKAEMPFAYILK